MPKILGVEYWGTPYRMTGHSETNIRTLRKVIRKHSFSNVTPIKDGYIRTGAVSTYILTLEKFFSSQRLYQQEHLTIITTIT